LNIIGENSSRNLTGITAWLWCANFWKCTNSEGIDFMKRLTKTESRFARLKIRQSTGTATVRELVELGRMIGRQRRFTRMSRVIKRKKN
jgi:hypothetical protein